MRSENHLPPIARDSVPCRSLIALVVIFRTRRHSLSVHVVQRRGVRDPSATRALAYRYCEHGMRDMSGAIINIGDQVVLLCARTYLIG